METCAKTKFLQVSPRKVRLVVDQIRGKEVEEALNILKFTPKRSAALLTKVLRAAITNAENTQSVDVDKLYVKQVTVDGGGCGNVLCPGPWEGRLPFESVSATLRW